MIFRSNSQCHLFVELLQFLQSFCTQTEQGDIAKKSCCVSFFKYLDKYASLAKERGREGEFVKLKTITKRFRDFLERDHLLGEDGDLTMELIEKYSGQSGSDYIFPILSSGGKERKYATELKNHNNHLKQIAGKTKIDLPLTSYVARHSWASIAKRGGVPIATISECMGHTSERTTAIYLASFEENVIDEANRLTILSLD